MSTAAMKSANVASLREASQSLLGKQILIENLTVHATKNVQQRTIATRKTIALAVSQIELFPHLVPGTKYHYRFNYDERAQDVHRDPNETFAFQAQGGTPAVSIVLPGSRDAIAVIKKVMAHDGEELTWSALLQRLNIDVTQFKDFVDTVDGIQTTDRSAKFRLQNIDGLDLGTNSLQERPNPRVPNLDSVSKLSRVSKESLRELLPELLAE